MSLSFLPRRSALLSAAALAALLPAAASADIALIEEGEAHPSLSLFGRLQYDFVNFDSQLRGSEDVIEMRRFRLGVRGGHGPLSYKLEGDFSQGEATLKDAYLEYETDAVTLRAGQFKTPNSLEELTSSGSILFMERGQTNALFGLGRRIGIAAEHAGEGYVLQAGVFGNAVSDDLSDALDGSQTSLSARGVLQPVMEEGRVLHLGAHLRQTDYSDGARFSTKPAVREYGSIARFDYRAGSALGEADSSLLTGLEALWMDGRFLAQSEIMRLDVDGPAGDPSFTSGYLALGVMLTDDRRSYKTGSGTLGGVTPNRPVTEGGYGAWQAGARIELTDFDDATGGELNTYAANLSWWPTRATRVVFEAGRSESEGTAGINDEVEFLQARLQLDW